MILGREFYLRASFFQRFWLKRQVSKLRVQAPFFHSGVQHFEGQTSSIVPEFIATPKELAQFTEAKKLEVICPTNAIKVTAQRIEISKKNCIGCMECVKASPENFFRLTEEKLPDGPDTN